MKIAIPSASADGMAAQRSGHFGHTPYFAIVEYDDELNVVSVESVTNVDHDSVGCGGVIEYVMTLGVDGIVCAGMGRPPFTRFTQAGIDVYIDATAPLVGDVARLFAEGRVARMAPEAACNHHH